MCDEQNVEQIAAEIQDYLHQHPAASDTLEGIAHWWLAKQFIRRHLYLVEAALRDLINQGVVDVREGGESDALYHLKQSGEN